MAEETYIVVAIDGTSSREFGYSGGNDDKNQVCVFNESYTREFHRRVTVPDTQKYFNHGPDSQITGGDSKEIEQAAWDWLRRRLEYLPNARVVLVGHSRGGHIVINLAIRLSKVRQGAFVPQLRAAPGVGGGRTMFLEPLPPMQPVHFLGLYDAVDMTYALGDTSEVPANVVWFYHALRGTRVGSRKAWGNTGTKTARKDDSHYFQKEFDATHGAVGGAIPEPCAGSMGANRVLGFLAGGLLGKAIVENASGSCDVSLTAEENAKYGKLAHEFIIGGARNAGIPLA